MILSIPVLPGTERPDPSEPIEPTEPIACYTEAEIQSAIREAEDRTRTLVEARAIGKQELLREELEETRESLDQITASVETERRRLLEDDSGRLVELAFAIARRVVRVELASSTDGIVPLVNDLLNRVSGKERITVRLSPRDHARITSDPGPENELATARAAKYRVDRSLEPGDCRVETEGGDWDGRVETQLERIEEALRAAVSDALDEKAESGPRREAA